MLDIVIVCERGELELKSLLLATSLSHHLKSSYSLNIAIPDQELYKPRESTLFAFANLGCNTFYFTNAFLNARKNLLQGDKTSNKLYAIKSLLTENPVLLLDSDILASKSFNIDYFTTNSKVLLKIVNRAHAIDWRYLYNHLDIPYPNQSYYSSIDKVKVPPYFNSGVIYFPAKLKDNLLLLWLQYFEELSKEPLLSGNRYPVFYRDQISLALAFQKTGIEYKLLDEKYNFPIRGKRIKWTNSPILIHYHTPMALVRYRILRQTVQEFIKTYPEILQAGGKAWQKLFGGIIIKRITYACLEEMKYQKYLLTQTIKNSRRSSEKN